MGEGRSCLTQPTLPAVIPPKAGIQLSMGSGAQSWAPAFAGVTDVGDVSQTKMAGTSPAMTKQ